MPNSLSKSLLIALLSASLMLIVGCSTPRTKPASVTDRTSGLSAPAPVTPPGYYRVKKGDTLARIALDHGQAPRDVAQWNTAANPSFNPNLIEVDDLVLMPDFIADFAHNWLEDNIKPEIYDAIKTTADEYKNHEKFSSEAVELFSNYINIRLESFESQISKIDE